MVQKRVLPKGLQSYNQILNTLKGLFPQSYRDRQQLASMLHSFGVDSSSVKETIETASKVFHMGGEDSEIEFAELIKAYEDIPKKPTQSKRRVRSVIQETSLKGHLKSYIIKGVDGMDYKTFLNHNRKEVKDLLNKHEKPIKMKMILTAMFKKGRGEDTVFTYSYFHSKYNIITESTNLDDIYDICKERIIENVDTFQNQGSGWHFR